MQKSIFCPNEAECVKYANVLKVERNWIYSPLDCIFFYLISRQTAGKYIPSSKQTPQHYFSLSASSVKTFLTAS